MIELVRRPGADLAHRPLQFGRFLTRCNTVGLQTVAVLRQVDGRGPENESPGVLRRMQSAVNHQSRRLRRVSTCPRASDLAIVRKPAQGGS